MIERGYESRHRPVKYHAVVIDAHRILKGAVFVAAVGVIFGIIISMYRIPVRGGNDETGGMNMSDESIAERSESTGFDNENVGEDIANSDESTAKERFTAVLRGLTAFILGFDPYVPTGAVASEIPGADIVNSYSIVTDPVPVPTEAPPTAEPTPEPESAVIAEGDSPIKAIDASQNAKSDSYQIRIGNQTNYGVDINELLSEPLDIDMTVAGPKILIVHTHTTESYSPEGATGYNSGDGDRSMDAAENVTAVGDAAARIFNERGMETLHDTEIHDYPSFNGSYAAALATTEEYLAEYPSIQIVFDIHRDSIVYDDGTKIKPVTEIDGRNAAQLMFVVGTNEKGLYHPNWRENLKFAIKLQDRIDQKYPSLMRYVNLRQERFNGHTTKCSVIIEVGSSGNSLSEAVYGMSCAAECIADYLLGL